MVLPDDVLIEDIPDFLGFGQVAEVEVLFASQLLLDDLIAQLDALIADVNSRTGDQLSDLILGFSAEGALELTFFLVELEHGITPFGGLSG